MPTDEVIQSALLKLKKELESPEMAAMLKMPIAVHCTDFLNYMACADYLRTLVASGSIDDIMHDQLTHRMLNNAQLFEFMKKCANLDHVRLTDIQEWDYEYAFTAIYDACLELRGGVGFNS